MRSNRFEFIENVPCSSLTEHCICGSAVVFRHVTSPVLTSPFLPWFFPSYLFPSTPSYATPLLSTSPNHFSGPPQRHPLRPRPLPSTATHLQTHALDHLPHLSISNTPSATPHQLISSIAASSATLHQLHPISSCTSPSAPLHQQQRRSSVPLHQLHSISSSAASSAPFHQQQCRFDRKSVV